MNIYKQFEESVLLQPPPPSPPSVCLAEIPWVNMAKSGRGDDVFGGVGIGALRGQVSDYAVMGL